MLDHHVSAQRDLEIWLDKPENLELIFDMERSGAQIAWDYFCTGLRPIAIDLIGKRDLWQFERGDEVACAHEVMQLLPQKLDIEDDFRTWDRFFEESNTEMGLYEIQQKGAALLDAKAFQINALLENFEIRSVILPDESIVKALIGNCPYYMVSDTAHEGLATSDADIAVCYTLCNDGEVIISFRSREGGVDVAIIAKLLGGGGHKAAAGCKISYVKWRLLITGNNWHDGP